MGIVRKMCVCVCYGDFKKFSELGEIESMIA